jgi:8-oxo-dGTP diphosphatase
VEGDGNGWARCDRGHRHWGRFGAAGLLLHAVDDAGVLRVLLQHRAAWSHHGGTWGVPGGARDSHEDEVAAALREAAEEAGLDPARVRTRHAFLDDHGGWGYTTVHADVPAPVATAGNHESAGLAWVPVDEVAGLPLHPGFAQSWATVRARPAVLVIDTANLVGSRPDGWWRDRVAATDRVLGELAGLRGVSARSPAGRVVVVVGVVAVLEGAARSTLDPPWVEVVRAPDGLDGDDAVVDAAARMCAGGGEVVVVTADRGLRARLGSDAHVVGPRWVLELTEHRPTTR